MTVETLKRAKEIEIEISKETEKITIANKRLERLDVYIKFLDGRVPNVCKYGKTYKKVDIKFNYQDPTLINYDDRFNIVDENKKEFINFLSKSKTNYEKNIAEANKKIKELEKEFETL